MSTGVKNRLGRFVDGVQKIREFGDADEIAEFLRDLGYKGTKRDNDCPVARFMLDCVGDPDAKVGVTSWSARYRWERDGLDLTLSGSAASRFITDFDCGEYPDLLDDRPLVTAA